MKILSNSEIKSRFGKLKIFSINANTVVHNRIKYHGGIAPFDDLIKKKKIAPNNMGFDFAIHPKGFVVIFSTDLSSYQVGFPFEEITYWAVQHPEKTSAKKKKSVTGWGWVLIGGAILGPVGAITGGLLGLKDKDRGLGNLVLCSVKSGGQEKLLIFSCKDRHAAEVNHFLKINFDEKVKDISEIKDNDSISRLIELKTSFDSEQISKEEFESEIQKIIS